MAKNQKGGKNSKDANNKGGKSNKGGKNDKKEVVAKAPEAKKVREPKGPVPDYKHSKVKAEVVQTDLNVIWNGWSGLVEYAGMQFRTTKINGEKRDYQVVHVVSAPQGTELYGLGGSSIHVTVQSLHLPKFHSSLEVGSAARSRQERIWKCLDKALREAKIKGVRVHSAPKVVECKHENKASASVTDLIAGVPGLYNFERDESMNVPRAVFRVKNEVRAPQLANASGILLVVELVSVESGHTLSGIRSGTYVPHRKLSLLAVPHFNGARAGDCQKIWEFLAGIIADHHKAAANKSATVLQSVLKPQGAIGEGVAVPREYRLPKAA